MRKAGIILLVLAITAAAGFGFIRTGFFQKLIRVFQSTSAGFTERAAGAVRPDGSPEGRGFPGGGSEGRRPRDGGGRGGGLEGRGLEGGAPGGGQSVGGLSLAGVGWFAAIMAFFAMATFFLDRGVRRTAARRRRAGQRG
jgi:hypothetical protein